MARKPLKSSTFLVALIILLLGAALLWFPGRGLLVSGGNDGRSLGPLSRLTHRSTSLSSLDDPEFVAPENTAAFTRTYAETARYAGADYPSYYTYSSPTDRSVVCMLTFWNTTAAKLPGNSPETIAERFVQAHRDQAPKKADDLILPSVLDDGSTYSLPTLTTTSKAGNVTITAYYSAAIFKSGKRVFMLRNCTANGSVPANDLKGVNDFAKTFKVIDVNKNN